MKRKYYALMDDTGILENINSKLDIFSCKDVAERTARLLGNCKVVEVFLSFNHKT